VLLYFFYFFVLLSSIPSLLSHFVTYLLVFFFNDTATTEIYTLSLHDALPICLGTVRHPRRFKIVVIDIQITLKQMLRDLNIYNRSEERFSRNAETDLVCRLLLEKKKDTQSNNEHHAGNHIGDVIHEQRIAGD